MALAGGGSGAGALCAWACERLLSLLGASNAPVLWVFVLLNVLTQYVCIRGVYMLVGTLDPLTVNVVLTARKALSVAVSIVVFGNTFTPYHVLGATLVFGGSLAFGAIDRIEAAARRVFGAAVKAGAPVSPVAAAAAAVVTVRGDAVTAVAARAGAAVLSKRQR